MINMKMPFYVVNAFTNKPFSGNPAGAILNADELDEKTMQNIAAVTVAFLWGRKTISCLKEKLPSQDKADAFADVSPSEAEE
ncbi:MAG: PhzF family phenazine biosynthesis protein [Candidatus Thermoplasmatota archaeon]|nr:PhzF family phenazine biosynthesis protein [Candidatus Thermoplasmatota archaeon]